MHCGYKHSRDYMLMYNINSISTNESFHGRQTWTKTDQCSIPVSMLISCAREVFVIGRHFVFSRSLKIMESRKLITYLVWRSEGSFGAGFSGGLVLKLYGDIGGFFSALMKRKRTQINSCSFSVQLKLKLYGWGSQRRIGN